MSGLRLQDAAGIERAMWCGFSECHGVRIGQLGCTAERSKGGGMGEAHDGGHERSRVPQLPDPAQRSNISLNEEEQTT